MPNKLRLFHLDASFHGSTGFLTLWQEPLLHLGNFEQTVVVLRFPRTSRVTLRGFLVVISRIFCEELS